MARESDPTDTTDPGLPRSTVLVSVLAISLTVLGVFFLIQWSSSRTAVRELRAEIEELEAEAAEAGVELDLVSSRLDGLEGTLTVLEPGRFEFCNDSDETVIVKGFTATYLTEDNTIQTFASSRLRTPWGPVAARQRERFEATGWEGQVTFYSLWLHASGQDWVLSGTWPPADGSCVRWPPSE